MLILISTNIQDFISNIQDFMMHVSFPSGGFGQSVIILRADMSSYVHIGNKKKLF